MFDSNTRTAKEDGKLRQRIRREEGVSQWLTVCLVRAPVLMVCAQTRER